MEYIKGKYKMSIYDGNNGYKVGLFRVKDASDDLLELVNHTVHFSGIFTELNDVDNYIFYGEYSKHEKYGYQFKVVDYEKIIPTGEDAVYEFLASPFIKGCGSATAKKIVEKLGSNAINIIKEDKNKLYEIGIKDKTADKIYESIMKYYDSDDAIIYLKNLGFSINEINIIINGVGLVNIKNILENNLYSLVDFIDFKKLDQVYFKLFDDTNEMRIKACIVESIKQLNFENGDTYSYKEEIINYLNNYFKIDINNIDNLINNLCTDKLLKVVDNNIYLYKTYEEERYIELSLNKINKNELIQVELKKSLINEIETNLCIKFNDDQIDSITSALNNNITIITGGPGTGKTTLISGILQAYKEINRLSSNDLIKYVSLLAPTGRASKRMSESTVFPACTIHRYLKWNKDTEVFLVDEYNKTEDKLIIVDEVSMIDNSLMASLLKGIRSDVRLILVGDEHQLPSVGPGNILKDLIESNKFKHIRLTNIYRQSKNSFIPILASEIRNANIESNLLEKKDDFNFIECESYEVKDIIKQIIELCNKKGLNENNIQILAPMYKSINGIDNLNELLHNIYNPSKGHISDEIEVGYTKYIVGDKVINLQNNVEAGIYNGDIGFIKKILLKNSIKKYDSVIIDFYGNEVELKRDDLIQIKHAYAMSIHKSQGSEFDHVIMPLTSEYKRMLYNRLIYTGISRAKKSLIIIGSLESFMYAVKNNYSIDRKTTLFKNNI